MAVTKEDSATQPLILPEELILMLLNEENGYFHQVPGWHLNCAVIGAVLAELSLLSRIDTDMESLFLVDQTETGIPVLDPILKEIANEPTQRNAQFWIERLAPRAESIIDLSLDRLVDLKILEHHDGDFWTLAHTGWQMELGRKAIDVTADEFIKLRIMKCIYTNAIPKPRDIIIICLINTCDIFRFMFQLDEDLEKRIELICQMDLIGRSIAHAVTNNLVGPLFRRFSLAKKKIPGVSLPKLVLNMLSRKGNIPAVFADLTKQYGPVFQIRPPFQEPMIFLSGAKINRWVHRNGRLYLKSKDYFTDIEKVYGASGLIPGLDGAEHFRLRKAMQPGYSRERLENLLNPLYGHVRAFMADWKVGSSVYAVHLCRRMINAQISPLILSIDSQDVVDDLIKFKERALTTHVAKILPKFLLHTPDMKRPAKAIDAAVQRVQDVHTPAQRAGCPRTLVDDLLSLYASDPQFLPESNMGFSLSAPMLASMYLGDALAFALYAMASHPELYGRIRSEADALFDGADPDKAGFAKTESDVTNRFIMECMRMYPIVPMSIRNVMNSCVVEGYELPVGARIGIAQTAPHYMEDVFPNPFSFDIDRYLPPCNEHLNPGYAPYGLGTHTCLGFRWVELQLAVNLLMVAHYFTLELSPANYKLRFNPFPSMSPSKRMKFRIAEQRRKLPV
ncbi:MAG: cytochrome P450 [Nitrospira sp.]|nr:cytochrome P450 [Nitrospira sp.]